MIYGFIITVTESAELAKKLSGLTQNYEKSAVTGTDGKCTFLNLSQGMYLVREINAEGESEKYDTIAPYLISLPLGIKSDEVNYWKYDVLSEPKTKVKRKNDTDSNISSDSDKEKDSDSYDEKNSESDKKTVDRNDPQPYTPVASTENSTLTSFFDIEKVKTGVVTNVILLFVILFMSLIIIVLTVCKKEEDDKDKSDN